MKITLGIEILGQNPHVVGIPERYNYINGIKGEKIGTTYELILPHARFEKIKVSTPELNPAITQEQLDHYNMQMKPLHITFDSFSASPYVDKAGNIAYSAKADRAIFPDLKKGGVE